MKTDDLLDLLAAAQAPVDTGALDRALSAAAIAGLFLAALLVILTLGMRPDLTAALLAGPVAAKFAFAGSLGLLALLLFRRALRPGVGAGSLPLALAVPVAILGVLALSQIVATPMEMRPAVLYGRSWTACVVFIPLYAVLPFAALVAVGRRGAPVHPGRAGLAAGLAAGALAAMAYALHCPEDTLPFVFAWYGGALALCTAAGWVLGGRLLRW